MSHPRQEYKVVEYGARALRTLCEKSGFKLEVSNKRGQGNGETTDLGVTNWRKEVFEVVTVCPETYYRVTNPFKTIQIYKSESEGRAASAKSIKCTMKMYQLVDNLKMQTSSKWERELIMDFQEKEENFLFHKNHFHLEEDIIDLAVKNATQAFIGQTLCRDGTHQLIHARYSIRNYGIDENNLKKCQLSVHFNMTNEPPTLDLEKRREKGDHERVKTDMINIVLETVLKLILPIRDDAFITADNVPQGGDGGCPDDGLTSPPNWNDDEGESALPVVQAIAVSWDDYQSLAGPASKKQKTMAVSTAETQTVVSSVDVGMMTDRLGDIPPLSSVLHRLRDENGKVPKIVLFPARVQAPPVPVAPAPVPAPAHALPPPAQQHAEDVIVIDDDE